MEHRAVAQLEAEKPYAEFIAWSKTALYRIVAVLIVLAFFTLAKKEQKANATVKSMHR